MAKVTRTISAVFLLTSLLFSGLLCPRTGVGGLLQGLYKRIGVHPIRMNFSQSVEVDLRAIRVELGPLAQENIIGVGWHRMSEYSGMFAPVEIRSSEGLLFSTSTTPNGMRAVRVEAIGLLNAKLKAHRVDPRLADENEVVSTRWVWWGFAWNVLSFFAVGVILWPIFERFCTRR